MQFTGGESASDQPSTVSCFASSIEGSFSPLTGGATSRYPQGKKTATDSFSIIIVAGLIQENCRCRWELSSPLASVFSNSSLPAMRIRENQISIKQ